MSDTDLQHAAALTLRQAYEGNTISPLRDFLSPADGDGAYCVQRINTDFWLDKGRKIVGRKIGLTAKAVQAQLGVDQPDFGVLFGDMQMEDGAILPAGRLIQPKAEAEIAFVLGKDLSTQPLTLEGLIGHIDYACAAIEIVDSRIADWKITFADTVADNGSSGMFVLGPECKPLPDLDLWSCGMVLEVDEEVVSIGAGAACLGHPLNAALWLTNLLADSGRPMRAGEIILSGALGPMVPLTPHSNVRASIGGLGSVGFQVGDLN